MEDREEMASPEWTQRSVTIGKLAVSLCKAQGEIEAVKKDSDNPFFKSKYADLASVWAAIRSPLTKNGLCILQEPTSYDGYIQLTTTLMHVSGEFVRSSLALPVVKNDPQGYGSACTYARRYSLMAVVGISPEDDDGNAASLGVRSADTSTQKVASQQKVVQQPVQNSLIDPNEVINFGKHKGTKWSDAPSHYLDWLSNQDGKFKERARAELNSRTVEEVLDDVPADYDLTGEGYEYK